MERVKTSGREREVLLVWVDKQWNVKNDASRFWSVGPTGILYIGYLNKKFTLIITVCIK